MTYINAANDLTSQEHIGLPAASVHSLKRGAPCCVGQGLFEKIVLNMKIKITGDKLGGRTTPSRHIILGGIVR